MMRNYLKRGYWWEWLLAYGWQWVRPIFDKNVTVNKIYDLNDIGKVRSEVLKLKKFNGEWFTRIFEPETKGVRVWEYGLLLNELKKENINNKNVLDVGSGGSLLADYLTSLGAKVTTIDLEKQMETRKDKKNIQVTHVVGDMAKMKFTNDSFDIVISISAIEHVGSWKKTVKALKEIKRVTKPEGKICLSTDIYLPQQKTDNWVGTTDKIEGAFEWMRLEKMAKLLGIDMDIENEKRQLIKNKNRANFRGRYFTTVFLFKSGGQ